MPSSQQQQQQQSQTSYNTSFSTFVTSSFSSSSSSSHGSGNNQSHSKTFTEHGAYNSRDGGRIERTTEETGKPVLHETTDLDPRGHSLGGTSSGGDRLVEDVGDEDRKHLKQH